MGLVFVFVSLSLLVVDVVLNLTDTGNKADPSELSFQRGDILDILDRSGKWWEARKLDGTQGSECFFSV